MKKAFKTIRVLLLFILIGFLIPQSLMMPVDGADSNLWAPLGWQKMFYLNPIDYLSK